MFHVNISNGAAKDIKKLPRELQTILLREIFPKIEEDPFIGQPLKGSHKEVFKYKFSFKASGYRVAYRILKNKEIVFIIMAGSRENFYDKLKRRIGE